MTPTHYHILTNQRGTILKIFGGTVCRFLLETPETYRRYGDNYDTEIKTIVCSLDNLRPITKAKSKANEIIKEVNTKNFQNN